MKKLLAIFTLAVFLPLAGLAFKGWGGLTTALAGGGGSGNIVAAMAIPASEGVFESAQAGCYTPQAATAQVFSSFPRATLAVETNIATVVEAIVAVYNARPPVTTTTADLVMVFGHPDYRTYKVMFFNDGCRVGLASWPIEEFKRIMSGIGQAV
jgi:hypothetical protein